MTKVLCDFCGKELSKGFLEYEVTLTLKNTLSNLAGDRYDLCNECKKSMVEWITAKKKEREHE